MQLYAILASDWLWTQLQCRFGAESLNGMPIRLTISLPLRELVIEGRWLEQNW